MQAFVVRLAKLEFPSRLQRDFKRVEPVKSRESPTDLTIDQLNTMQVFCVVEEIVMDRKCGLGSKRLNTQCMTMLNR